MLNGLELKEDVAAFLLNHFSRGMQDLMDALRRLDQQALVSQRKLTIPLVKDVLDL